MTTRSLLPRVFHRVFHRVFLAPCVAACVLGLPDGACGQKPARRPTGPKRFVDTWANPNVPVDFVLRGDGVCSEVRRDGTVKAEGGWQASGTAAGAIKMPLPQTSSFRTYQVTLVSDDVLILQQYLPEGGSEGDGTILYRSGYDWAGKNANKVAADKKANDLIVGKWTHPNSQRIFEADRQGGWLETRKNGGEPIPGAWSICDDGTFWIEYENRSKLRVWAGTGRLAIQPFSGSTGELFEEGLTVSRAK